VQVRRERFGEPIGQRLDQERAEIVVLGLKPSYEIVGADAGGAANPPM
jgi:hypothetical protein